MIFIFARKISMFFNYRKSEKLLTVIICHTQKRRDINRKMSEKMNSAAKLKREEFVHKQHGKMNFAASSSEVRFVACTPIN